jgi:hypothetical protein
MLPGEIVDLDALLAVGVDAQHLQIDDIGVLLLRRPGLGIAIAEPGRAADIGQVVGLPQQDFGLGELSLAVVRGGRTRRPRVRGRDPSESGQAQQRAQNHPPRGGATQPPARRRHPASEVVKKIVASEGRSSSAGAQEPQCILKYMRIPSTAGRRDPERSRFFHKLSVL